MSNFFIKIYDYFTSHRGVMWGVLLTLVVVMSVGALRLSYNEDITNIFPENQQRLSRTLSSLKQSNRLVIFVNATDDGGDEYDLIDSAEELVELFCSDSIFMQSVTLTSRIDESLIDSVTDFIYSHTPSLLDDEDWQRIDSLCSAETIEAKMEENFERLISVMGGYISDYIYRDPLAIATNKLKGLEMMGTSANYNLIDGYILSSDNRTLILYVDPTEGSSHSKIVKQIESILESFNNTSEGVRVDYFGAPAVAYYNAKQIKFDSMVTLNIAIIIVAIFILIAFAHRRNVLLILSPVVFGVLFSLWAIYLIQGSISLIAVGSGSIIFGLAFSYAIHFISHAEHSTDIYSVIRELVYPLTIGSITTIGAFVGLLFTSSQLLQDFGLFASLALIGTTLFSLLFLPQFIIVGGEDKRSNRLLDIVDNVAGRAHEHNRILVWSIALFAAISGIFFFDVNFDSDMMNLNYNPPHLQSAEARLRSFSGIEAGESNVILLASSSDSEEAIEAYEALSKSLDSLQSSGVVSSHSGVFPYIISYEEQLRRISKWQEFWSEERKEKVLSQIAQNEDRLGFERGAFDAFTQILQREYSPIDYGSGGEFAKLFSEWISVDSSSLTLMSQIQLRGEDKDVVYSVLSPNTNVIVADRAYFAGVMARDVSDNFYLVLYISGLLIFSVLLLSYGRMELALISFMPMFIAWVIIVGLMSIFGVEFNIVTIILSTFIFGIGDDFSIFVMDGLQGHYRDRSGVLSHHKRAIFISALSLVVGMGALVFARHPAMYSLGLISLIGMAVVVLVSYTISPLIFRALITSHTSKGNAPFSILSLLNTIYAFGLFVAGCFGVQLIIALSHLFIYRKAKRQLFIHTITSWFTRVFLKVMVTVKRIEINPHNERFETPAMIIANHQSFIDILIMLGLNRKMVMVTNSWVWSNPFFGRIVRFLGFFHTADGYETEIPHLRKKVDEGYSIIIFPEGSRSIDNEVKRFHKGAFYMAEKLGLDIIPVVLYGAGLVSSKRQPLYIKHGQLVSKILPRISPTDAQYGVGYRERTKSIHKYFKREYNKLYEEFNRTSNSHFRDMIIRNYIYKGPVLEWYMRVKLRIEGWYDRYDRLLPRRGVIVDLGCGYGAMSYMLMMLSNKRRIIAVDYDSEKIAVAKSSFLKSPQIEFECADLRTYDIPSADAYIISDVLHYLDYDSQRRVIERCISQLSPDGVLIIRDGDTSQKQSHRNTESTEKWSTEYIKFNKTDGELCFLSRDMICDIAQANGTEVKVVESGKNTSNTLFLITHKQTK